MLGCVDLMSKLGFHTAVDVCVCFVFFSASASTVTQVEAGTQPQTTKKGHSLISGHAAFELVAFPGTQPEGHRHR